MEDINYTDYEKVCEMWAYMTDGEKKAMEYYIGATFAKKRLLESEEFHKKIIQKIKDKYGLDLSDRVEYKFNGGN